MRLKEAASGSKILGLANGFQSRDALDGVHQVVCAGRERGIDLVIGKAAALAQDEARALEEEIEHLLLHRVRRFDLAAHAPAALCAAAEIAAESESGSFARE